MMSSSRRALSYYEELQARMRALLIATGMWISAEQLSLFNELIDANECGVVLDMLSEALISSEAKIDDLVFQDVQSLSEQMGLGATVAARLRPLVS